MNRSWQRKPLWSIANEVRRVVEPSDLGPKVVHYSIPAIDSIGTGQLENSDGIRSAKLLLDGGEVLISKLNPRKSRVVHVRKSEYPMVSSTEFIGLRAQAGLCPDYLAYYLQSETVRQELDSQVQSVTRSHQRVAPEDVLRLAPLIPDLIEQRRIADFLDAETSRIDRLQVARDRQKHCVQERIESDLANVVEALFVEFGRIALRRVSASIEQGWSPQCDDAEAQIDEWAVLKTSAVSTGRFRPEEHKRLPAGISPSLRYEVRDGDILLTRGSGSPAHVGVAALAATGGRKLLLSDLLYRLRLDHRWDPQFVTAALASRPVRGQVQLLLRGQSGQTIKLRSEDILAIEVPLVPSNIQRSVAGELSRRAEVAHRTSRAIERSNALLSERRQALITAAVTGQFDVTTASGRNTTQGV